MLQLISQDVHIQELLDRIKNALKRRDPKAAIDHFNKVFLADYDRLWKLLRLWSVTLIRFSDNNTLIAVRLLYDNYLLDPQKEFIERALTVIAYGNISS